MAEHSNELFSFVGNAGQFLVSLLQSFSDLSGLRHVKNDPDIAMPSGINIIDVFATTRQPPFLVVIRPSYAEFDAADVLVFIGKAKVDYLSIVWMDELVQGGDRDYPSGMKAEQTAELFRNSDRRPPHSVFERTNAPAD